MRKQSLGAFVLMLGSSLVPFVCVCVQRSCISCSRSVSWWMRVFLQCCCNCSPVPFVAARCWPAPLLHHFQEAALVALDNREHPRPHRASLPVKRAKRRTRRKTKMVSQLSVF